MLHHNANRALLHAVWLDLIFPDALIRYQQSLEMKSELSSDTPSLTPEPEKPKMQLVELLVGAFYFCGTIVGLILVFWWLPADAFERLLRFLQIAASWPVVTLACVIIFITAFKREISTMILRIKEGRFPGGGLLSFADGVPPAAGQPKTPENSAAKEVQKLATVSEGQPKLLLLSRTRFHLWWWRSGVDFELNPESRCAVLKCSKKSIWTGLILI